MDRKELQNKRFYVDVIKLCEAFPGSTAGFETAKQFIRSAGSGGQTIARVQEQSLEQIFV